VLRLIRKNRAAEYTPVKSVVLVGLGHGLGASNILSRRLYGELSKARGSINNGSSPVLSAESVVMPPLFTALLEQASRAAGVDRAECHPMSTPVHGSIITFDFPSPAAAARNKCLDRLSFGRIFHPDGTQAFLCAPSFFVGKPFYACSIILSQD
jgi:hypothetical protein